MRAATFMFVCSIFCVILLSVITQAQNSLTHNTGTLEVTIIENGYIGDDVTDTYGGVVFNGNPNAMFTAGYILADNGLAWGNMGNFSIEDLFNVIPITGFYSNPHFNEITYHRVGLTVDPSSQGDIKSLSNTGHDFVFIRADVYNTGDTLTDVYPGIFADWNVGNYLLNRGGYVPSKNLFYMYENGGAADSSYYGIMGIAINGVAMAQNTIRGTITGDYTRSYTVAFAHMTSTAFDTITTDWDYRMFISFGPFTIPVGTKLTLDFAIVAGTSLTDLQNNADTAFAYGVFIPVGLTSLPQIALTGFSIFNESVSIGKNSPLKENIAVAEEIVLDHWQYDFSIEYAGLHFSDPTKNQYKYMLTNYDNDWRDVGNSTSASYTNMSPGEYVFRVIGSNSDLVWNEEGTSIRIIILPPWWANTWAYIIYALIVLSIIYFTWRLQLKRIRLKHDYEMSKFEAEKMYEVDEMKSRFFANISHEFRTPLTMIFGPAKDIIEETNESKIKQYAGIIKRNASKLYNLVNQLLDISKLEAGRMTLETSEQNIIPLLKGLVLSFTSLAERKKITLQFNTIEENLNVYIDNDKVEKIVTNLLSNAFKFTPEGGNIDFTAVKMINEVEMRIADNGVGIPKERIDKIFDRFYQVDGSHTRESEGTGIGLALTKELVELHKGKIKVESKEEEGTTFTVLLPLGKEHLKPEEIVEKEIQEETTETIEETELISEIESRKEKTDIDVLLDTDKPLLLIVEDNSDVRKFIISHLEEDYRIQEAVDGEDGFEQALNHIPDLIISDVMMPKMDGFELCNKLKTDEKTSHIPIIMLTAKATSKDKIEGYETGVDDYIMKPFDAAELKVRIKNLIEIRRKLQEKFSAEDFVIPKQLSSVDERFMNRVLQVINEHISEEEFGIEKLGNEAAMSRKHLHRKLKALTGKSPSQFVRSLRLTKARSLIKEKRGTISEISFMVGFSSPIYFNKCFKEEFGYSPSGPS
jgi:signal transduction histidine kinase/DNA-binding response OmpR family regulator